MKKRLSALLALTCLMICLCSCNNTHTTSSAPPEEMVEGTTTVTTTTTTKPVTTTTATAKPTTITTTTTTTTVKPTTTTTKATTTTTVVLDIPEEHQWQLSVDTSRSPSTDVGDIYDNGYLYFYDEYNTKKLHRMHVDDRRVEALPITSPEFTVYKDRVYYLANSCLYRYDTKTKATDTLDETGQISRFFIAGDRVYALCGWVDSSNKTLRCVPQEGNEAHDIMLGSGMNWGGSVTALGYSRGHFLYVANSGGESTLCAVDYRGKAHKPVPDRRFHSRLYYGLNSSTQYIHILREDSVRGDYTVQLSKYGQFIAINLTNKMGTALDIPSGHLLTKDCAVYISSSSGQYQAIFVDWSNRKTTVKLPEKYSNAALSKASTQENLVLVNCVDTTTGKKHTLAIFSGGTVLDLTALAMQ